MSNSFTDTERTTPGAGVGGIDEARELNQIAATLSQHLFSASRTVHLHALENRAAQNVLVKLHEILARLHDVDGRASLRVSTDLLMVNDQRVVVDSQSMGPVVYIVDEMKRRKVEEIDFAPDVPVMELGRFLQVFFAEVSGDDVFGAVRQAMTDAEITGVRIIEWVERPKRLRDSSVGKKQIREESNKLYNRAVLFTGEVLRNVEQQRAIPIPKALRLTQQIVDIIQVDESILVGLASIKSHDEYTFAHSANVAVLSMLIADRIGLPKSDVARVGLAALVHDIGKTHVPREVLNKETPLTDDEWMLMKDHALFGALELSRSKGLRAVADSIFVAYQHHVRFDGDGYPQKPGEWKLIPMSRIVTVADYFDAMTTPRVYKKVPMTPDRALRFILDNSGVIFDPFLAKTFIQVMGLYPVGTVVELSDGRLAVVSRQNPKTSLMHRPVVSLIPDGGTADLAETDDAGAYPLTILHAVYDPDAEAQKIGRFVSE